MWREAEVLEEAAAGCEDGGRSCGLGMASDVRRGKGLLPPSASKGGGRCTCLRCCLPQGPPHRLRMTTAAGHADPEEHPAFAPQRDHVDTQAHAPPRPPCCLSHCGPRCPLHLAGWSAPSLWPRPWPSCVHCCSSVPGPRASTRQCLMGAIT